MAASTGMKSSVLTRLTSTMASVVPWQTKQVRLRERARINAATS